MGRDERLVERSGELLLLFFIYLFNYYYYYFNYFYNYFYLFICLFIFGLLHFQLKFNIDGASKRNQDFHGAATGHSDKSGAGGLLRDCSGT